MAFFACMHACFQNVDFASKVRAPTVESLKLFNARFTFCLPQFSMSSITRVIIGYSSFAEVLEEGKRRTISDHLEYKLDTTIIAKTVFVGSSELRIEPIIFPPMYETSKFIWISSMWMITLR